MTLDADAQHLTNEKCSVLFVHFKEIDSTNSWAKRFARGEETLPNRDFSCPLVITADQQTQGRGTKGSTWESDSEGGLYYTLYIPCPRFDFESIETFQTQIARCILQVLSQETGVEACIKPPNDIFLQGKKLGGILVETASQSGKHKFIVVGIGLNLNQTQFSEALTPIAISLRQTTNVVYNKMQITSCLTKELLNAFTWY